MLCQLYCMRISKFGGTPRKKSHRPALSPPLQSVRTFTRNQVYVPVSSTDYDSFIDDRQYLAVQANTNNPPKQQEIVEPAKKTMRILRNRVMTPYLDTLRGADLLRSQGTPMLTINDPEAGRRSAQTSRVMQRVKPKTASDRGRHYRVSKDGEELRKTDVQKKDQRSSSTNTNPYTQKQYLHVRAETPSSKLSLPSQYSIIKPNQIRSFRLISRHSQPSIRNMQEGKSKKQMYEEMLRQIRQKEAMMHEQVLAQQKKERELREQRKGDKCMMYASYRKRRKKEDRQIEPGSPGKMEDLKPWQDDKPEGGTQDLV